MGGKQQVRWAKEGRYVAYLREHYPTMTARQLSAAFNAEFGLSTNEAVIAFQLSEWRITKRRRPDPP